MKILLFFFIPFLFFQPSYAKNTGKQPIARDNNTLKDSNTRNKTNDSINDIFLNKSLIKEMKSIKVVNRKNFDNVFHLFGKVSIQLEKNMDKDIIINLGKLIEMTFEFDPNYYVIEALQSIIFNNEKNFLTEIKKTMNSESYKILIENIDIMKREIMYGNG